MTKVWTPPRSMKSDTDEDSVDLSFVLDDPMRKLSTARYPDFETGQALRQSWLQVPINMVVQLRSEKADPRVEGHLQFVGMDDIEADGLTIAQRRSFADMKSVANRFRAGDMLYGRLRPYLNKTAVVNEEGACSGELLVLTPSAAIIARYLQYFMHSRRYVGWVSAAVSGDRPRVGFETLAGFAIPLPPVAEQQRIVARIDSLFADIAKGEAALAAARKGLETFRRALLKAAITGELTKNWRAENPVCETGRDVLARIAKQRLNQGGRARVAQLAPSPPPELPNGWDWATLDGIAQSVRNGTSAAPSPASNQHEILRISAVRPLRIDEAQIRFLDDDQAKAAAAATVEAGDLLFTRYNGSADLVGVGAIYRGPKRFYPDKIIRVRLELALSMLSEFVAVAVNTGAGRKHIAANIKTTAGQQGLSGESLKATPIPIPPPAEAAEIVRRLSDALAAAADTLTLLDTEAADAARLKQSILNAAFEGRLVPQDPDDEPATALLARLAASPPASRAKRGRARKSVV